MIVIIDNYDSFTYNLYQIVALSEPDVQVFRHDQITVPDLLRMKPAGIILSPGPGRPEDAGICMDLIKALDNTPLLGVCLGHQAIVQAFGGLIIQAPSIVHGKRDDIFHSGQGLYQGLPNPFSAGRYHSLIADKTSLPKCLLVEAQTSTGLVMGIHHAQLPIYGIQFHPESYLTPLGEVLLHNFVQKLSYHAHHQEEHS